ncbi:hypothetical protein B0H66DRAFT_558327 [Apodospora peruviana]|uniref:Secreted protein n=1 Tax=Apodospora peruviana TaxID=516989 RepID=A0AAE0I5R6_9PEZI|nr:hypothetical protein B0H66DRAFT_558327 [Apodospora peruviana]
MLTLKALVLAITTAYTVAGTPMEMAPRQGVPQDVAIECFPGAGGFPFSVTIISSLTCFTSAELGEGFPMATAAQLLSDEVPSCRVFEAADCTGLSTTFGHSQTQLAPGIAGHPGSWMCP